MLKQIKKREQGFTIIEVLIVLAIAGLIMLIVFLAVPALQRNSRNTQRRNDVSGLLGAVQEVMNNNNGAISSVTSGTVIAAAPTPSYYTYNATNVTVGAGAQTNATSVDSVSIRTGAVCSGSDAVTTGATSRQIAILYTVEASTKVCTNS